jgi:hypothetical protein
MKVGDIYNILKNCNHHSFPVEIIDKDITILSGTITRKVLVTLIKHKAFGHYSLDNIPSDCDVRLSPLVNWGTLECLYPDYPNINDLDVCL